MILCWSRYWDISNKRSVGFDAHLHTKGSPETMPITAQGSHNDTIEQFKSDKTMTLFSSRYWDISNKRSVGFDAHL